MANNVIYAPIIQNVETGIVITNDLQQIPLTIAVQHPEQNQIKGVIVKVIDPVTGAYLLKNDFVYVELDFTREGNYIYYLNNNKIGSINIDRLWFKEDLTIGESYQISVRAVEDFPSFETNNPNNYQLSLERWMRNNPTHISIWSEPILINTISEPDIQLVGMSDTELIIEKANSFFIEGNFVCQEDNLKWYQIYFNQTGEQTDRLIPVEKNTISHIVNVDVANIEMPDGVQFFEEESKSYQLTISYMTQKGYHGVKTITIKFVNPSLDNIEEEGTTVSIESISAKCNEELGCIDVIFTINNQENTSIENGKHIQLTLFRTSNKTNFLKWEIVKAYTIASTLGADNSDDTFLIQDMFAESGNAYQYKIKVEWSEGEKKYVIERATSDYVSLVIEDIFLTGLGAQLRIKYNPTISQFKRNVADSITATLGGAYPVARRNGNQRYTSFQIGGLISCNSEIYDDQYELQDIKTMDSISNNNNRIINRDKFSNSLFFNTDTILDYDASHYAHLPLAVQNTILEKVFRDKVIDFLYNDDVKIFKSMTEGLKIVRLSNISFTPEVKLGRSIYSFTATATEVMAPTFENYRTYFVQNKDEEYYLYDYTVYGTATAIDGILVNAADLYFIDEDNAAIVLTPKATIKKSENAETEKELIPKMYSIITHYLNDVGKTEYENENLEAFTARYQGFYATQAFYEPDILCLQGCSNSWNDAMLGKDGYALCEPLSELKYANVLNSEIYMLSDMRNNIYYNKEKFQLVISGAMPYGSSESLWQNHNLFTWAILQEKSDSKDYNKYVAVICSNMTDVDPDNIWYSLAAGCAQDIKVVYGAPTLLVGGFAKEGIDLPVALSEDYPEILSARKSSEYIQDTKEGAQMPINYYPTIVDELTQAGTPQGKIDSSYTEVNNVVDHILFTADGINADDYAVLIDEFDQVKNLKPTDYSYHRPVRLYFSLTEEGDTHEHNWNN